MRVSITYTLIRPAKPAIFSRREKACGAANHPEAA
jgi:hypothetical protein